MMASTRELIARKREGGALEGSVVRAFVRGVSEGDWSDAQVGAFLMASFLRGLDETETVALTAAMRDSGERFDLGHIARPKVDKHSTGGVGDKVSLPLAPLMAACGLAVPMISGRGLGHTGGTLDKLESIPGFRTDLSVGEVAAQVERLGVAMAAQTPDLVPADRRLYALRDVTATVECRPLIVSSILSKKLVEDLDGLVLDVKCGAGAFFADPAEARELAEAPVSTARGLGVRTSALLTAMDQPLGRTVGNALEVAESIELLGGGGPPDLREIVFALGAEMLRLGGLETTAEGARGRMEEALASGAARTCFARLIEAQGGDPAVVEDASRLPRAAHTRTVEAPSEADAWVGAVDARAVAEIVLELGGGRQRENDGIDPAVGVAQLAKIGERVGPGSVLGVIHASDPAKLEEAAVHLRAAVHLVPQSPPPRPLILERLSAV